MKVGVVQRMRWVVSTNHLRVRRWLAQVNMYALTIWAVLTLNFVLPRALPGDPILDMQDPWLGTNDVGQDILSELIYGAHLSLLVGVVAGTLTLILATLIGMVSGYVGGTFDAAWMRLIDILMAIPHLPLMILIAARTFTSRSSHGGAAGICAVGNCRLVSSFA
ncbi:MAG: hypothetical protein HZB51_24630 [Chloroflexi bacterium]|nr:hypothetical protein [Chloroflexota bacterium]